MINVPFQTNALSIVDLTQNMINHGTSFPGQVTLSRWVRALHSQRKG
jgi:hypothetical protein